MSKPLHRKAFHIRADRGLRGSAAAYRFRESLFLLPVVIVIGGIVLALVTGAVDNALGARVPFTMAMDIDVATWLLSTIAGATITTAGVIFSLTIVSLQLASSQLSPRVMRSFIRDRLSQVVIGLLVATFVYCVLTLPRINGHAMQLAPRVSVTVAVVLTIVTVVTIIAHLDHLAHRLEVGRVVRDIAAEGRAVIDAVAATAGREHSAPDVDMTPPAESLRVTSRVDGWVSRIDTDRLLAAVPERTTVRLDTRVGAYVHQGEPLVTVWPSPARADQVRRRLAAAIAVTGGRNMQQDVDFSFRQLVDIGLRALSAAINDPTTAVEATLRVGSLLRRLLVAPPLARAVAGPGGRILLRPWELDPEEYIAHGFDQLRHVAPTQPLVAATILRVLRMLIDHVEHAGRPELVPALRKQIEMLLGSLEKTPGLHPDDLARLHAIGADTTDPADHSNRRLTP